MRFSRCDRKCPDLDWRRMDSPRPKEDGYTAVAYCKIEKKFVVKMKACPKKARSP